MPSLVLVNQPLSSPHRPPATPFRHRVEPPLRGAVLGAVLGPLSCLAIGLVFFASGHFGFGFLRLSVMAGFVLGTLVGSVAASFRIRWLWAGGLGAFLACSTFVLLVARHYALGMLHESLLAVWPEFALGVLIAVAWGIGAGGVPAMAEGAIRRMSAEE